MTVLNTNIDWAAVWTVVEKTTWQSWLYGLAVLAATFLAGQFLAMAISRQARRRQEGARHVPLAVLLRSLPGPVLLAFLALGVRLAGEVVFGETLGTFDLGRFWIHVSPTLAALAAAWFFFRLAEVLDYYLGKRLRRNGAEMNARVVPVTRKLLQTFVIILAMLFIAQNVFDWQIGALLAGLGIGGLAVALAAQQTLSNLFGSITIFADRPFQIRDTVRVRTYVGVVEDVGFRSTRLRTSQGNLVTIPNSMLAAEIVESFGHRPGVELELSVQVKPTATAERLARATAAIQALLDARRSQLLDNPPPFAAVGEFKTGGPTITVRCYFNSFDVQQYNQFAHQLKLDVLARITAEGLELA